MSQESSPTGGAGMGVAAAIVLGFALLLLAVDRAGPRADRSGSPAQVSAETRGEAATPAWAPEP